MPILHKSPVTVAEVFKSPFTEGYFLFSAERNNKLKFSVCRERILAYPGHRIDVCGSFINLRTFLGIPEVRTAVQVPPTACLDLFYDFK